MGGNSSKTFSSTNIFNESIAQVTYNVANKCASNTGITQTISAKGATITNCPITQDAKSSVNFQCLQSISFGADFKNQFDNVFKEKMNAEIANLGLGSFNSAEATSITSLVNRVSTNIDVNSVSSCISDSIINQTLNIEGAVIDCSKSGTIAQGATLSVLSKCTQNNSNITSALAEIDSIIDKKIEAASTTTNMIILIVIAVIAVAGIGLLTAMVTGKVGGFSGGHDGGSRDDSFDLSEFMEGA